EMRVIAILGEGFQVLEGTPVLHDGRKPDLVPEQTLLGVLGEVVEHVLHALAASKIPCRLDQTQRIVQSSADEENHEVTLELCGPATLVDLGHVPLPGRVTSTGPRSSDPAKERSESRSHAQTASATSPSSMQVRGCLVGGGRSPS